MANNYVDVKETIWRRVHFKDDTDMQKVIEIIKEDGKSGMIYDESVGFLEAETLYDTSEELTPEENGGYATVEVFEDEEMIWTNAEEYAIEYSIASPYIDSCSDEEGTNNQSSLEHSTKHFKETFSSSREAARRILELKSKYQNKEEILLIKDVHENELTGEFINELCTTYETEEDFKKSEIYYDEFEDFIDYCYSYGFLPDDYTIEDSDCYKKYLQEEAELIKNKYGFKDYTVGSLIPEELDDNEEFVTETDNLYQKYYTDSIFEEISKKFLVGKFPYTDTSYLEENCVTRVELTPKNTEE